ncbi:MAG TPA: hypothetical protein VLJ86_21405 [Ramlibacter sp.]|nr:hypothetical protein [Ramlibacter sp.]
MVMQASGGHTPPSSRSRSNSNSQENDGELSVPTNRNPVTCYTSPNKPLAQMNPQLPKAEQAELMGKALLTDIVIKQIAEAARLSPEAVATARMAAKENDRVDLLKTQ